MSDMYRDSIFWVEVERIKPNPFQPRREFDQAKLTELSESIRMYGLLQPLTVTRKEIPREDGGIGVEYELIAGERRLRASKLAGIQQIPVIIRSGEDDDQVKLELAIIENLQREDLNPVDRAHAFHQLHKKFGFTHAQIGKKMGKSREYVSNTVRLLSLPEEILGHLAEGKITEGHTRPLMMLNKKPDEQLVLAKEILLKKLTVRESEEIARRSAQDRVTNRHKIDPEVLSMERALTEKLGTRVTIEPREVGGRLVISFFSAADLQTLLDSMRMEDERATVTQVFDGEVKKEETPLTEQQLEEAQLEVLTQEQAAAEKAVVQEPESVAAPQTNGDAVEKEQEGTVLDSLVQVLSGAAPAPVTASSADEGAEKGEVSGESAEAVPMAQVEPSPDMPMPEPVAEPVAQDTASTEKKEDDSELYSMRNFSI